MLGVLAFCLLDRSVTTITTTPTKSSTRPQAPPYNHHRRFLGGGCAATIGTFSIILSCGRMFGLSTIRNKHRLLQRAPLKLGFASCRAEAARVRGAGRGEEVGLQWAPFVCHPTRQVPAPRQRARPPLHSTNANRTREGARARTECAAQDGAKQVGLPGRRWSCHLPPSLTETRRAPHHLPRTWGTHLEWLGTALGRVERDLERVR
jgi:hypothetical protein